MFPIFFGSACLSLFPFVHYSHATSTNQNQFLITSPNACIHNFHCADTSFCNERSKCVPRRPESSTCYFLDGECQDGLDCWSDPRNQASTTPVCGRARPIGGICSLTDSTPCVKGAFCSHIMRTCRKIPEKIGDRCDLDIGCRNDLGFYCDFRKQRCEIYKKAGSKCDPYEFTCEGFCTDSLLDSIPNICLPAIGEGKRCFEDVHCNGNYPLKGNISDSLVCNQNKIYGSGSICLRQSRLLSGLGMACNPRRDACNARKGLRCLLAKKSKTFVCQQRNDHDSGTENFCTPGSVLSRCMDQYHPLECRRDSLFGVIKPNSFFSCQRRLDRRPAKRGNHCVGFCEAGMSCVVVNSVLRRIGRSTREEFRHCVKVVRKGQACGDRFRSQCAVGLKCGPMKKCMKGVPKQYLGGQTNKGLLVPCSNANSPCAPGLVCAIPPFREWGREWGDLRCIKPENVMKVKAGDTCDETRDFRLVCEEGLVCARAPNDILRCRKPLQVGGSCVVDYACQGKLKCALSLGGHGICYSEKLSLPVGATCNPSASATQKRCSMVSTGIFQHRVYCLPKGKKFACQLRAEVYSRCSGEKNIVCLDSSLVCGKLGVCVPSDE